MNTTLQNINLDTAALPELWAKATLSMRNAAEDFATEQMASIDDPICGAREICIALYLRRALKTERAEIAKLFSFAKN